MRLIAVLLLSFFSVANASSMNAKVDLTPMGSFEVKTKRIRGAVIKKGDTLQAANIEIPVKSLSSDNETRDNHLKEKLNMAKFPNIVLKKAVGKAGRGQAIIEMAGASQKVAFQYEDKGKNVEVKFQISLKSYGISGINYMGVGVQDIVKIQAVLSLK